MSPSSNITSPPRAQQGKDRGVAVVNTQPKPVTMSMKPDEQPSNQPLRLRGGCIPCPVRPYFYDADFSGSLLTVIYFT
jgi:hypothetical protein